MAKGRVFPLWPVSSTTGDSTPEAGELTLRNHHVQLGEIGGAPFYIDGEQSERWCRPAFILDAAPGPAEGFSLERVEGVHFLTRAP